MVSGSRKADWFPTGRDSEECLHSFLPDLGSSFALTNKSNALCNSPSAITMIIAPVPPEWVHLNCPYFVVSPARESKQEHHFDQVLVTPCLRLGCWGSGRVTFWFRSRRQDPSLRDSYNGRFPTPERDQILNWQSQDKCPSPLLRDVSSTLSKTGSFPLTHTTLLFSDSRQPHTILSSQWISAFLVLFQKIDDVSSPEITNPIKLDSTWRSDNYS